MVAKKPLTSAQFRRWAFLKLGRLPGGATPMVPLSPGVSQEERAAIAKLGGALEQRGAEQPDAKVATQAGRVLSALYLAIATGDSRALAELERPAIGQLEAHDLLLAPRNNAERERMLVLHTTNMLSNADLPGRERYDDATGLDLASPQQVAWAVADVISDAFPQAPADAQSRIREAFLAMDGWPHDAGHTPEKRERVAYELLRIALRAVGIDPKNVLRG